MKGSRASFANCYQKETLTEKSVSYFASLYVFLFFVSIVVIATIYDYYLITKETELIMQAQNFQKISIDSHFERCIDSSYLASSTNSRIFALSQGHALASNKVNLLKTNVENGLLSRVLLCFSAIENSKKLFNTSSHEESISCLHGIKFVCMLWIIIGHSYSFGVQWLFFSNPSTFKDVWQDLLSQIFANGTFSVDIFFFIRYV